MGKIMASELRPKSRKDLLLQLNELRNELAQHRVFQVTNGAASKLAKIWDIRKNIARVLTIINQQQMSKMRKQLRGKARKPKALRAKLTRAMRRALTPEQKAKKTEKQAKKDANFPRRRYALRAAEA